MTWEETIIHIRKQPEFQQLVEKAYFEENLELNVHRFQQSEEYQETRKLISHYIPKPGATLLDIGAGNGISSIAFALDGYQVTALEPDASDTIGAGAIRRLARQFALEQVRVLSTYAETMPFADHTFDIVYTRQAMHHAHNLNQFVTEAARVLKKGGILLTVRDHVITSPADKELFLQIHPLHKYYGGENAYSVGEYLAAFKKAGLTTVKTLRHYDSIINYFPETKEQVKAKRAAFEQSLRKHLKKKVGILASFGIFQKLYRKYSINKYGDALNESNIPGRLYSFVSIK